MEKPKVQKGKMIERKKTDLRSQSGFTLLETMSVLVILGVIFSATIQKFTAVTDTATQKALVSAIQELNIREALTWYDSKISTAGWENDPDVFKALDTKLGTEYHWDPAANELGGTLHFGNHTIALTRTQSTDKSAASWQ
jgi:prepilin-type N-terminal cleavage/methylation domain-containing protein